MEVTTFIEQTLSGLADISHIVDSMVTAEGPIVDGYAFVSETLYLHFYYNAQTGTTAFALIRANQRIWGIDYDKRRGWHLHPFGAPDRHEPISAKSISEIIDLFAVVVASCVDSTERG
ncbi:MAG TPA: hypothetical protein DCL15_17060 [Chloroflexi bacterium]|nr:hypothetical protein [Chloroflexota bacterium]